MDLRLEIRQIIKERRDLIKTQYNTKFNDIEKITNILLNNYNETINFLSSATNIEIACVIDSLTSLVKQLPKIKAQKIVEIFKQKQTQFTNIQDFTSTNFNEQIKLAENYTNRIN